MAPALLKRIFRKKLDVTLPKLVQIENTRLKLLHLFLQFVVFMGPVIFFIENRQYLKIEVPQSFPSIWGEPPPDDVFDMSKTADMQREFCTNPGALHYKYSDAFTYLNFDCLEMSTSELFYKIGKDIIYFPTYFTEEWEESISDTVGAASPTPCETLMNGLPLCPTGEWLGDACYKVRACSAGASCTQTCSAKRKKHFFPVGVGSMSMAFSHSFEVEGPDNIVAGSSSNDIEKALAMNRQPVLTVIYSQIKSSKGLVTREFDCNMPSEGKCRFEPGNSIILSIEEWLKAARVSLDDENILVRANEWNVTYDGPRYEYPVNRITGVEIMISVKYEENRFHTFQHNGTWGSTWPHALCSIIVKGSPTWTGLPQNRYEKLADAGDKYSGYKMRQRWYEGVRFIFISSTASQWGFVTMAELVVYLASMIVYLGVADGIVTVIATHGLGATSKTYSKAQKEPLRAKQQCTQGLPSRLLQSTMAFYALTGLETMEKKGAEAAHKAMNRGFSYETLHRVFKSIMDKYKRIDPTELAHLTRKVFNALSSDGDRILLSDFCEATASNECFDLQALVDAFDWDREKGCLEQIFKDGASVQSRKTMESRKDVQSPTADSQVAHHSAPIEVEHAEAMKR
eukprot:GEMP01018008.1.p1 GENE.GEMP01018008.1~~GEMP01018008.1.p1  ORF type:complete len:627 (+),score=79.16 GEMP01018008.1:23-1903(+)